MNPFLTLDDVEKTELEGKKVFLRLDLNMPMTTHDNGVEIKDASRLEASMKTLSMLKKFGARTLIVTHIGRPKDFENSLSTEHVLPFLCKKLTSEVHFAKTITEAEKALEECAPGGYVLLENIRFWKEEEKNDPQFSKELSSLCDIYVNDAFSVSHREHASVFGVPSLIKIRIAGYNLQNEIENLDRICQGNNQSVVSLVGGAKVSTKMKLLQSLLERSRLLILGGGMANTFLVAIGCLKPGKSYYEESFVAQAKELYEAYPYKIFLPIDAIVTDDLAHPSLTMTLDIANVPSSKYGIVDIGPKTLQMIKDRCSLSETVLWNGPFGVFEKKPFDEGSKGIATILAELTKNGKKTVAGGGDTLACLGDYKNDLSFVSTAGGAFLEYLEQGSLPGVRILFR